MSTKNPIQILQQNLRAAASPSSNNQLAQSILQQVRGRLAAVRENPDFQGGATGALDGYYLDEASIDALAAERGGEKTYSAVATSFRKAMETYQANPNAFGGKTPADLINAKVRARLSSIRSEREQEAAEFSTPGLALKTVGDALTEAPLRIGYDIGKAAKALTVGAPEYQQSALLATTNDPIRAEARAGNVPGGQFSRALIGTDAINVGNRPETASVLGYYDESTGEWHEPDIAGGLGKYVGSGLNLLYKATLAKGALDKVGVTQALSGPLDKLGSRGMAGSFVAGAAEQAPIMVTLGALNRAQQTPTVSAALDPVSIIRDDVVNSFIAGGMERLLLSSTIAKGNKNLQEALKKVGGSNDDFLIASSALDDPLTADLLKQIGMSKELRAAVKEVAPQFYRQYGKANVVSPITEFIAGYAADRLRGEDYETAMTNGLFFGLLDASAAVTRGTAMRRQRRSLKDTAGRRYVSGVPETLKYGYEEAAPDVAGAAADPRLRDLSLLQDQPRMSYDDAAFDEMGMPVEGAEPAWNLTTNLDTAGYERAPAEPEPANLEIPLMQYDPTAGLLARVQREAADRGIVLKPKEAQDAEAILKKIEAHEKKLAREEKRKAADRATLVKGLNVGGPDKNTKLSDGQRAVLEDIAIELDNSVPNMAELRGNPGDPFSEAELREYADMERRELDRRAAAQEAPRSEAGESAELAAARAEAPEGVPAPVPPLVTVDKALEDHSRHELQRIATRLGIPSRTATKAALIHTFRELGTVAERSSSAERGLTASQVAEGLRSGETAEAAPDPDAPNTWQQVAANMRADRARTFMPGLHLVKKAAAGNVTSAGVWARLVANPPKKLTAVLRSASNLINADIRHRRAGTPSGAPGQFDSAGVLLSRLNSTEMIAHEVGHGVLENIIGARNLPSDVYAELMNWGAANLPLPGAKSNPQLLGEAYAVYTAARALDPQSAKAAFPRTDHFHDTDAFKNNSRKKKQYDQTMEGLREIEKLSGAEFASAMTASLRANLFDDVDEPSSLMSLLFSGDYGWVNRVRKKVVDAASSIFRSDVVATQIEDDVRDALERVEDPEARAALRERSVKTENSPTQAARHYTASLPSSMLAVNVGIGRYEGVVNPDTGVVLGTPSLRTAIDPAHRAVSPFKKVMRMLKLGTRSNKETARNIVNVGLEYAAYKRQLEKYDSYDDPDDAPQLPYARIDAVTNEQLVDHLRASVDDIEALAASNRLDDPNVIVAKAAVETAERLAEFVDLQMREVLRSVGMERLLDGVLNDFYSLYLPMAKSDPANPTYPLWDGGSLVDRVVGNNAMVANGMESILTRLATTYRIVTKMKAEQAMLNAARLHDDVQKQLSSEGQEIKKDSYVKESGIRIVDPLAGVDMSKYREKVLKALNKYGATQAQIDSIMAAPESWAFFAPTGKKNRSQSQPDSARHREITVYDSNLQRHVTLQLSEPWWKFLRDIEETGDGALAVRIAHKATSGVRLGATGLNATFALVDPIRNAAQAAVAANIGMARYGVKPSEDALGTLLDVTLGTGLRFGNALVRSYMSLGDYGARAVAGTRTVRAVAGEDAVQKYERAVQSAKDTVRNYLGAPASKMLQKSKLTKRLDTWARLTFGTHAEFNPAAFDTMGGALSGFLGPDMRSMAHADRHLFNKGISATKFFDGAKELFSASELTPKRIAMNENYNRLRHAGYSDTDAKKIAFSEAKDVQDFQYTGSVGRLFNKLTPYFSAQLVGVDKMFRTMVQPMTRRLAGKSAPKVSRAEALQAWAKATTLVTLPSLFEWLLNKDEDWWQELPEQERYGYWHLSTDHGETTIRLPKTHEVGMLFGTLPIAWLDTLYRRANEISPEPDQLKRALTASVVSMIPGDWFDPSSPDAVPLNFLKGFVSLSPAAIKPLSEVYFNRSSYSGREVVPGYLKDNRLPEDQVKDYTTKLSKTLGDMFGTSPLVFEHVMNGHTGNLYGRSARGAESVLKWFMHDEGAEDAEMYSPVQGLQSINPFYREGPYYKETRSETRMFAINEEVKQVLGSFEAALENGDVDRALSLLPRLPANYAAFDELTKLHREVRKATWGDRETAARLRRQLAPIFRSAILEYESHLE